MSHDPDSHRRALAGALRNQRVVEFVRETVRAGYLEVFSVPRAQIDALVDGAFDELARSRAELEPKRLAETASDLADRLFGKNDPSFWFSRAYHHYKTQTKPETDFQQLRELISGKRVLDYGCGSGYLAARLARGGYQVVTTDVLDYRFDEARQLPFVRMTSSSDIPFPDDSLDTALVQAVLHHVDPEVLPLVIQRLARIAEHVLIKEDSYGLPSGLPGLEEKLREQPLLRAFTEMPHELQYRTLVLIDYFANAIAQGISEMNMPFAFRTVTEWREVLEENGLKLRRTLVAGFEPGRAHKSCHVWFACDRAA
jgi:SAM-dependent methyltransferase